VGRVAGNTKVESQTILNEYDSYYYPRHRQSLVEKPLPVLLVKMANDTGTLFYLDPQDGRLLAKLDRSRRVFRWLYSGLHHWDFGWLYQRPIWDAWMLIWVSFGLVLGASSLVVGWRRLKQTFLPKRRLSVLKKLKPGSPYLPRQGIYKLSDHYLPHNHQLRLVVYQSVTVFRITPYTL